MNCVVVLMPLDVVVEAVLSSFVKMPLIRYPGVAGLLSVSDVAGGGNVVGEETGLVSLGASFIRLALTSATQGFSSGVLS